MRSRNKKERVWRIIITLQRVGYFVKVRSRITSYNAQYLSGGYMKGITCFTHFTLSSHHKETNSGDAGSFK